MAMTDDERAYVSLRARQMTALEHAMAMLRDAALARDPDLRGDILRALRATQCAVLRLLLQERRERKAAAGGAAPAERVIRDREALRDWELIVAQAQRYSIVIRWSEQDQAYVVRLPEWKQQTGPHGHMRGAIHTEALHMIEDLTYVVSLPEREQRAWLHGRMLAPTYEEGLLKGMERLELLVARAMANGETLPEPKVRGRGDARRRTHPSSAGQGDPLAG